MPIDPEKELLLDCLRVEDAALKSDRLAKLSPANWETVTQEAIRHGVAPLLAWRIKSFPTSIHIPAEVRKELHSRLTQNAGKNMRLYHQLGEVLRQFQEAGIPVIALKGVFLASVVYEEFALRLIGDIDLLVQWDDLARADKILIQGGYEPSRSVRIEKEVKKLHHLPPYTRPQSAAIELHWSIARPTSSLEIDQEGLWNRARPTNIASVPVLALAPEDLLLHLCTHYCQHAFRAGLRHLYDIVEVLNFYQDELAWEKLITRVRQWGASKCVYLTLYLAQELLGGLAPADVLSKLRPEDFNAQIFDLARGRVLDRSSPASLHPDLVGLWGTRPLNTRLTPFLSSLFPPREYISQKYLLSPDSNKVFLYYLVRWKDLFRQYGGQLWKMASREKNAVTQISQDNILDDWLVAP